MFACPMDELERLALGLEREARKGPFAERVGRDVGRACIRGGAPNCILFVEVVRRETLVVDGAGLRGRLRHVEAELTQRVDRAQVRRIDAEDVLERARRGLPVERV